MRETARCATTQAPSVSIPDGIPGVGRGDKCLFCHVADISRGELACVASLVGLRSLTGMEALPTRRPGDSAQAVAY